MTDLQLHTEEVCCDWGVKWTLQQLSDQEVTENKLYLTVEQVMRDWDLYCGRDYPELPELTDSQWEGCMDSIIDRVSDKLGL